jgi:predicted transcriptional regulator
MKDISKNYITIQGWMVKKLNLKSNDLLTYSLIYGFCQDSESEFTGSITYICEWLNCSKNTAKKSLSFLCENNLIEKTETFINGVQFNKYKINHKIIEFDGGGQNLTGGGSKIDPNIYNNKIEKYIYSEPQKKSDIDPQRAIDIIQANIQASKENEYSYTDFLNDFNKYREQKANIKHPIETLTPYEKMIFNQNNKDKEYYKYALAGLFYQDKIIQSCITRPKHLLESIEKYHDAGKNKIQLYQTKEK